MLKNLLCHSEPHGRRISRRLFASLRVTPASKCSSQKGFTLLELLIVIALIGFISVAAAMSIHQVLTGTILSNDTNTAINQVRNAGHWISRDAQMAQTVVADNPTTPEIEPVTGELLILNWTAWDGDAHQVIYSLETMSGGLKELQRQETIGTAVTTTMISQYIDADDTSCQWDGDTLTVTITAQSGDKSETRTFEVKPRPDPVS